MRGYGWVTVCYLMALALAFWGASHPDGRLLLAGLAFTAGTLEMGRIDKSSAN